MSNELTQQQVLAIAQYAAEQKFSITIDENEFVFEGKFLCIVNNGYCIREEIFSKEVSKEVRYFDSFGVKPNSLIEKEPIIHNDIEDFIDESQIY